MRLATTLNPDEATELFRRYGLTPAVLGMQVRRGPDKSSRKRAPPCLLTFEACLAIIARLKKDRSGEQGRLARMRSYEARQRIVGTIRGLSRAVRVVEKFAETLNGGGK